MSSAVRLALSVLVSVVLAVFVTPGADAQNGAKALFHGPAGSSANPFDPVGIQYWFENEQGARFAQAREAGVGARVHLHVQCNTPGFLTAWITDKSQEAESSSRVRKDNGQVMRWNPAATTWFPVRLRSQTREATRESSFCLPDPRRSRFARRHRRTRRFDDCQRRWHAMAGWLSCRRQTR